MLLILGWYTAGLVGAYLMWRDWNNTFNTYSCPTPIGCLVILIVSVFGLILLFIGLIITLIDSVSKYKPNRNSWWNKPIC